MAEQNQTDGVESPIKHEPLVSDSLQSNAEEHAQGQARPDQGGEPNKKHGDALLTGTGTRHGVDRRDERPKTD